MLRIGYDAQSDEQYMGKDGVIHFMLFHGASLRRTLDLPSHLAASILLLSRLCPELGFLIQRPCQSC